MTEDRSRRKKRPFPFVDFLVNGIAVLGFVYSLTQFLAPESENPKLVAGAALGQISFVSNDIRHKNTGEYSWQSAKVKQTISLGDSVFTGKNSKSQVRLNEGGSIDLDSETLITFSEIDGFRLPHLSEGNFRLGVEGRMKIVVNGKPLEIQGREAEIQISVRPGKEPLLRVLKSKGNIRLINGNSVALVSVQKIQLATVEVKKKEVAEVPPRRLQLYDVYRLVDNRLRPRALSPEAASLKPLEKSKLGIMISGNEALVELDPHLSAYVLEVSDDPGFPRDRTNVIWGQALRIPLPPSPLTSLHYRIRGLNDKTEISDYSDVASRIVLPVVAKEEKAPRHIPVARRKAKAPRAEPPREKPRLPAVAASAPAPSLSVKVETPPSPLNLSYSSSIFQIEGAGLAMYSKEALDQGHEVQSAYTFTLRNLKWWGSLGLEAYAKKAVISNDAGGGTTNPFQMGLHLKKSYEPRMNPFPGPSVFSASLIAGFEHAENSGSAPYARQYDLLKLGFGLNFPVSSRWDTGGELLFGRGAGGSQKYEISGNAHFYLKRDLSLGAGYRVHLYDDPKDFYREGYGEGYSVLRWHY